jgi:multiple sugar transport system substrate-binding protein
MFRYSQTFHYPQTRRKIMVEKHVSRRQFLRLAGGAAGIGLLAACVPAGPAAPGTAPAGDTGAAAPAQEPGTLWVFHKQDFHPEYNDYLRAHIVKFAEERNLELDVAFTAGFAGTGADEQKIAAAVQAGDPPDVWVDNRDVYRLHQLGTVQPVDDLVAETVSRYGALNQRVTRDSMIDGTWYAVPFHVRSDGGWALKDVFEDAGIDIDSVRTYDDLREAAMEVSRPEDELWGWGMTVNRSGDGNWFIHRVLHGWGATWVDESGDYVTIDSPEAVEAVEWLVDTYTNPRWDHMLPPGVLSWTDPTNNEAFLAGKLAYTQNGGTLYASAVVNNNPVAERTVYHNPVGGPALQDFMGLGGMYHMLIQGAKNAAMGKELILSFYTDEVMNDIYHAAIAYAVPAYDSMWNWDVIQNDPVAAAQEVAAKDPAGWTGLAWPGPNTAQIGAVGAANLQADMVANVINGQMTAAEAVRDAHEKSVTIFQEFGAPGER